MKTFILALALLVCMQSAKAVFLDCVFYDGFDGEGASAPAAWKDNLVQHNCARRTVIPAANPPIPMLAWSATLAQTAQSYANQCQWRHSGAPGLGENLYASAPWSAAQTSAANGWASEAAYYNYAANTCAAGQQCGHYTQMVWRNTSQLGCGITNCSSGSPFGASNPNWTFVVCNYSPPGNYVGQRPY